MLTLFAIFIVMYVDCEPCRYFSETCLQILILSTTVVILFNRVCLRFLPTERVFPCRHYVITHGGMWNVGSSAVDVSEFGLYLLYSLLSVLI